MLKIKWKMSLLALLLVPIHLGAGWFGPNASDKAKVAIKFISIGCPTGYYGFAITNGSDYTVNKITFTVVGTIEGRSTEYDLNFDRAGFVEDTILSPFQTSQTCYQLNQQAWPERAQLILSAKIYSVEFKVKNKSETVF